MILLYVLLVHIIKKSATLMTNISSLTFVTDVHWPSGEKTSSPGVSDGSKIVASASISNVFSCSCLLHVGALTALKV